MRKYFGRFVVRLAAEDHRRVHLAANKAGGSRCCPGSTTQSLGRGPGVLERSPVPPRPNRQQRGRKR
ncbi:MAG: toxin-antitoxin system HicB family antitoxin [Thermodesulfobacteriota bacterium]